MRPLDGIRVLDFTRYQQGPFATVMLADMGAEVIKIEDTGIGDFGRRMYREADGFSPFFEALDRGKKSVCIDLRKPEGRDLILRLVESVDVVAENFRPGTMEGWGIGYETLRERNPRLIYGQATGWGTKGPKATEGSFDQIAQAYTGFAQHAGGGPGTQPEIPIPGVADQTGAMNFAYGIMTALYVRERTGIGQKVEVSLLGSQLALQATEIMYTLRTGVERPREFRASPTVGHYECGDGRWVMIVGIDQKFWPRICDAIERPDLPNQPEFARGSARFENRDALQATMEAQFRTKPAAYWLERLRACDVPCSLVQDYVDISQDEQAVANGYIVEQDHPKFGRGKVIGLHVQLSETPGELSAPAPGLGEHTAEVLREAGLTPEQIATLTAAGVIR